MHCSRGDDSQDYSVFLPRNLSYVKESHLDDYSVSSLFVHNPAIQARLRSQDLSNHWNRMMSSEETVRSAAAEASSSCNADASVCSGALSTGTGTNKANFGRQVSATDTSDTASEEGIFVNMMDDLESPEDDPTKDVRNGNLPIPTISSPDEGADLAPSKEARRTVLEEAVSKVANNLHSNTQELKLPLSRDPSQDGEQRSLLDLVSAESPLYTEEEFNFTREDLRKSTSLKAKKTPPGTPRRKKVVRFADAMGLDLESVRHILNNEAPPKIPASAMADLKVGLEEDRRGVGSKYLSACFQQPGAAADFISKVMGQKICLENAVITDLTITGVIRVANIGYHKSVRVRFSTNHWETFHDIAASYILNSCDSRTDRFSFSIVAPADFNTGSRLEFAISFTVNDITYWDNNSGKNYVFECFAKTVPTETDNMSWMHFL